MSLDASRHPRLVVAAPSSGSGKTTAVVALVSALRKRGLRVATFKCGPDYLDPTYHQRAAGAPCHNLDGWMMGRDAVRSTFAQVAADADISIIEGVMGLFDGASATSEEGSTAQIAKWLDAPVMLVVDAKGMARTIAAVAHGFREFDRGVRLAGMLANRVGTKGHLDLLRQACPAMPVFGALPIRKELSFPERHLGLQTASSEVVKDELLRAWGEVAEEWWNIDRLLGCAAEVTPVTDDAHLGSSDGGTGPTSGPGRAERWGGKSARCRIGIAQDAAFHFYYEYNLRLLREWGATLVPFSPLRDAELPEVDGVYLGGGYPEVHGAELAHNRSMLQSIRRAASSGMPMYAECGGFMYLSRAIRVGDARHEMAGVLHAEVVLHDRLMALGYVEVETQTTTALGHAGTRFRGHQFRYSELVPQGAISDQPLAPLSVRKRRSGEVSREGFLVNNVLGSYIHAHWASNPRVAEAFVLACARSGSTRTAEKPGERP